MDSDVILMLALPAAFVLFGLGWFAARVDIRHLLEGSKSLPNSYFRGLNFLLNEQPDRAIDSFIDAVKIDPDTVELHFTLGAMFRRRGETERAIRIHQALLARTDLPDAQRQHALLELARDYLKAGMLDRAEEGFAALKSSAVKIAALEALTEIFELEKEWERATEAAQELQQATGKDLSDRIAHFHCERAQTALSQSRFDDADEALAQALSAQRKSVRAMILSGELALARGDAQAAIDHWLGIEKQSVLHVVLVATKLMQAYRTLDKATEGLRLLQAMMAQSPSIDMLDVVYREVLAQQGPEAAHAIVLNELRRTPTLVGLDKLVEARLPLASPGMMPELELVKTLLHQQTRRLSRYTCSHCGFRARQFYWQCPGCRQWDAYSPRRVEELEVMK
jgi:lipopolysaccharide biosynthesis regulator YciM